MKEMVLADQPELTLLKPPRGKYIIRNKKTGYPLQPVFN
jgi:hypothetical protein